MTGKKNQKFHLFHRRQEIQDGFYFLDIRDEIDEIFMIILIDAIFWDEINEMDDFC
jgi:hypothetical protein